MVVQGGRAPLRRDPTGAVVADGAGALASARVLLPCVVLRPVRGSGSACFGVDVEVLQVIGAGEQLAVARASLG